MKNCNGKNNRNRNSNGNNETNGKNRRLIMLVSPPSTVVARPDTFGSISDIGAVLQHIFPECGVCCGQYPMSENDRPTSPD